MPLFRPHRETGRFGTFLFAFVLGVGCSLAVVVIAAPAVKPDSSLYPRLEIFAKVLAHIENNYVEPVDETKLLYGAVRGMVATLDPHTSFMEPSEYQAMQGNTAGEFGGLGFEFEQKDDALVVIGPIEDTPAARAGIRAGDIITAIDGISTRTLSVSDATAHLRGREGTPVTLSLLRPDFAQARPVTLVREKIRVVSVSGRVINGRVAYVKIKSFQDTTNADLKRTLDALRSQLGGKIPGLVLDLRNNPGGLLDQGVKVADRFLSSGVIVSTRGRNGRHPEEERAAEKDTEPNYPIVVLINRGTASASEVVAGALQDQKRATLIGTTSFGKGSVQTVIDLDDGSALKLTIARYYTPSGCSIQERGIMPDVIVTGAGDERATPENALPRHFKNDTATCINRSALPGERVVPVVDGGEDMPDPQLKAGVNAVVGWTYFTQAMDRVRAESAHK